MIPMLDTQTIATITGCPLDAVATTWPNVLAALDKWQIDTPMVQVAAIATIAVETPNFLPIQEKYANGSTPEAYFGRMYWTNREVAHQLGNLSLADAVAFKGRGLIQITGRDNYELYGELLGMPLDTKPELALVPSVASEILAAYFKRRGVADAAN
jgi:putative chitinase